MCLAYIPAQTITIYIYIKRVIETNARFDPSIWLPVFLSLTVHLVGTREKENRKKERGNDREWKEGRKEALSSGDKSFPFEILVAGSRRVTTIKRIVRTGREKRRGNRCVSYHSASILRLECPRGRTREKCAQHGRAAVLSLSNAV